MMMHDGDSDDDDDKEGDHQYDGDDISNDVDCGDFPSGDLFVSYPTTTFIHYYAYTVYVTHNHSHQNITLQVVDKTMKRTS